MTRPQAVQKATQVFQARTHTENFPDNAWVPLDRQWDLNLFLEAGQPHASLYPVDEAGRADPFGEIEIKLPEM